LRRSKQENSSSPKSKTPNVSVRLETEPLLVLLSLQEFLISSQSSLTSHQVLKWHALKLQEISTSTFALTISKIRIMVARSSLMPSLLLFWSLRRMTSSLILTSKDIWAPILLRSIRITSLLLKYYNKHINIKK